MPISTSLLCGQSTEHLAAQGEFAGQLHVEVAPQVQRLRDAAREQGHELALASAFRSFERQLMIWNAKASGARPVLDAQGRPLDIGQLSEAELLHAILRWSALPGASRHHWGTDMDVYDVRGLAEGERPQLDTAEYLPGGPFAALAKWMDRHLQHFDFFQPYQADRGGIAPEPWHISYRPLADRFAAQISPAQLRSVLASVEIALKPLILDHLDEIFERYIQIP